MDLRKPFAFLLVSGLLVLTFSTRTAVLADGLPDGWLAADIGDVGLAGHDTYADGVFEIAGAGADIWGQSDSFRFVYQNFPTNGEIVARVTSIDNTHEFAKAGIMFRQSLDPSSPMVIFDVKPDGGTELMTRIPVQNGTTDVHFITGTTVTLPVWLKLVRAGDDVRGLVSEDGVNWTGVGNSPFPFGRALVGLAVTSHDQGLLNTSRFDNVSVTPNNLPPEWLDSDVGHVLVPGSAVAFNSDVWTVKGSGADIWGPTDEFHFTFKEVRGNVEITARVNDETPVTQSSTFAKAGIMVRDLTGGDTPPYHGAAHVILDVRPNGEIEFMTRSAEGEDTQFLNGAQVQFPVWLRLERVGALVLASFSSDGVSWQQLGSAPSPIVSDAYAAGLAVTSHNPTVLNEAHFQNVLVIERQP